MRTISVISVFILATGFCMSVMAQSFTENNRKIVFLKESGSGAEGKSAAIKLDTATPLVAECFEDIIIFDAKTDTGKKTYQDLMAVMKGKAALKSISFTKDEEGDCSLEKYEK